MFDYVIIGISVLNTLLIAGVMMQRKAASPQHKPGEQQPTQQLQISPPDQAKLEQQATAAFQEAVNKATGQFTADLNGTSKRLNDLIVRLTTDVVERELEEYRQGLNEARAKALASLAEMQTTISERQKTIQADFDEELNKRRQFLAERLDQHFGEAAVAYIIESLGQGADLGAQRSFLLQNLERIKGDLKKDLTDAS